MFRRCHPLLLFILNALIIVPCFGQSQGSSPRSNSPRRYSVAGQVRDDNSQQPLESVRVDLKTMTGGVINSAFTRGNGDFEFEDLPNGDYFIEVNVPGYEPFRDTVMVYNGTRRGVFVFLRKPIEIISAGGSASVSAHELGAPRKAREAYERGLKQLYSRSKSDPRRAIEEFQRAIK